MILLSMVLLVMIASNIMVRRSVIVNDTPVPSSSRSVILFEEDQKSAISPKLEEIGREKEKEQVQEVQEVKEPAPVEPGTEKIHSGKLDVLPAGEENNARYVTTLSRNKF